MPLGPNEAKHMSEEYSRYCQAVTNAEYEKARYEVHCVQEIVAANELDALRVNWSSLNKIIRAGKS